MVGFGPPKLVDREVRPMIRLTPAELRLWSEASEQPLLSADAFAVYDVDAGSILYSRNAYATLPQASLTKLMTALLTLEDGRLDDIVEISADDLVGGASMGLTAGETISVRDLLWGLLVPSGNDTAMALARYVGGDVDTFVKMMNDRADEIRLANTHFNNPNGFDVDGHYTSALDLLSLTLELLKYPLFDEIVQTKEAEVAGRLLRNTNEFLGYYEGVTGVKTGTTEQAGQCLVTRFEQNGRTLLIVVLGSEDRYADVAALQKMYRDNYHWVSAGFDDLSVMNRLYLEDGISVPIQASDSDYTTLQHRWSEPELLVYRDIRLPVQPEPEDGTDEAGIEETQSITTTTSVGTAIWRRDDVVLMESELKVR